MKLPKSAVAAVAALELLFGLGGCGLEKKETKTGYYIISESEYKERVIYDPEHPAVIYDSPSTKDEDIIETIPPGEKVEFLTKIDEVFDSFYFIKYRDNAGWINNKYIKEIDETGILTRLNNYFAKKKNYDKKEPYEEKSNKKEMYEEKSNEVIVKNKNDLVGKFPLLKYFDFKKGYYHDFTQDGINDAVIKTKKYYIAIFSNNKVRFLGEARGEIEFRDLAGNKLKEIVIKKKNRESDIEEAYFYFGTGDGSRLKMDKIDMKDLAGIDKGVSE